MTVQLAAVPFVGTTIPNNRIMFSNGKTVEIETRRDSYMWRAVPKIAADGSEYNVWRTVGENLVITTQCFIGIWQNSADLDEVANAIDHIEERISKQNDDARLLTSSDRGTLKGRATRLRQQKGVGLKHLKDPALARAKQKKREEKEKKLNDLRELAASLS